MIFYRYESSAQNSLTGMYKQKMVDKKLVKLKESSNILYISDCMWSWLCDLCCHLLVTS